MDTSDHNRRPGFFSSRANMVLIGFLLIAGFYLVTEHRAHLLGWLPWRLLLACPLMHLFMHHGHGGYGGGGEKHEGPSQDQHGGPGNVTSIDSRRSSNG